MSNLAKRQCFMLLVLIYFLLFPTASHSQDLPKAPVKLVEGPMAKLAPILGTWEIDAEWANGSSLWARNEYKVGLGGKFVEAKTYAKNNSGVAYQRYLTVFGYDESSKEYTSWGFTYDGTEKTVPISVEEKEGKMTLTSEWSQDESTRIRQSVAIADGDNHYEWKVWQKSESEDWIEIMNGKWKRVD